ncbi:MAG: PAS domain S-box protein [Desulfobulbaceae bacterium]|nr:PAS domain S-box protein [Desulfobulbaceae bacterium]
MKENNLSRDQVVLQSLNYCAQAFLKSREFEHSTYTVYENCKKLIGATAGYVALLSADETLNELLFLDMGDLPCDLDPDLPMPLRGFRAEAYSTQKVVYENDFRQSEWQQYLPDGHGLLDNVLFAPLVIDEKAIGIFGFANKPGGFSDDDVLVVSAFAELAAIGLMKNRATENLEKNVNHLHALMQTANDAIITVDQQGDICFWNKAAEKCFGYNADEIVGKPCTCIVPEKYVKAHEDGFARVAHTGVSKLAGRQVVVEGLKKTGETVPVELSVSKWEVDNDVFFTGIVRDITIRRQMEEEARISEKRLRDIFKLMQGGGGVYKATDDGEDFIIVEFHRPNDMEDVKELDDNLAGRRFLDVFPASKEHGLFNVFQRVWKTGKPEYHPVTVYDGPAIKAWRSNYVYKISTGEIVALYEDITERKRMEKALLESENLFRSIFETSPDPININRLDDGKFILVNSKFLELTGYAKREVIGRSAQEINLWTDLGKREQFFAQLVDKWQVTDFEAEFRRKDGKILTALVSAKLLSYQNNPHILSVCRDITELKETEQALLEAHKELEKRFEVSTEKLKESEIKYSSLVDALLTGVYMCVEEKIVFVNEQFVEMFGYSKDELLSMNMSDLIHPEDKGNVQSIFEIKASGDTFEEEYEIRGVRKYGDILYLSGRNTDIEFNGRPAVLGNIADITKRKEAEKELQKSEEGLRILSAQLLSAEERERKRIASEIHDSIGQALSAIKFSVESSLVAMSEQSFSSAEKLLEKIIPLTQQSIDEVRRIIMDLRPSILDDLGLVATISWFCREFESIYTNISIEKEIHVEENDIPVLLKTVIYRILQEALNNAAKYSSAEHILFRFAKTGENLELLIEDTGLGFDIEKALLRDDDQRGLGLSSMKERATLSGGTFNILSAPGIGTRIHVVWPLKVLVDENRKINDAKGLANEQSEL